MSGIYLHIPFCKQACHYCDFHFSTSLRFKDELLKAMLIEIELQKEYLGNEEIKTIYFGGGTPSILSVHEIESLLTKIHQYHTVNKAAEITLEANPDDLSKEKLKELKQAGINRLSIGIQSFRDEDLQYMNRAHSKNEALTCLENVFSIGFENITIDLIYGIPGLGIKNWENNLNTALSFPVNHISAYCLTVEKNTALHKFVLDKKSAPVNEQEAEEQFLFMTNLLKEKQFIHYEVSNFGKENYFSQHNSSYWKGKKYLGIGPSAHSYNLESRQYNISNNKRYIDALVKGEINYEKEFLTLENQFNEYLMIGLRTMWGINEQEIKSRFGERYLTHFKQTYSKSDHKNKIQVDKESYILNQEGMLFADRIASEFFLL